VIGTRERRARGATTAIFFLTGWVYAAWATRIPAIKEELVLSDGALALAIVGLEAGAIVGLPAGAALVGRLGSRRALQLGFAGYPTALFAVALTSGLGGLTAALAVMALATSVVDVAMNAQGIELERRYERPVLSGLHAGHPFGLAAGGVAGTAAAAGGIPVVVHFAVAAGVALLVAMTATVVLVREPTQPGQPTFVRPSGRLLLLGLIAFCAFLLDGTAYTWSAVHLRDEYDGSAGLAAAAFTVFAGALAVGRLFGDRLVVRWGRVRVVQGCGTVAAAGAALAVLAPTTGLSIAGWALFGLGLAPVAPTVLGAAPGLNTGAPAVAIAAVTTVGYLGSFTGPPAIGALAELIGLSAALGLAVVVGAVLVLLARPGLSTAHPRRVPRRPNSP
jgi:MFS family permease